MVMPKMTDESGNLVISNITRDDTWRPHIIKKHKYRRLGVRPPDLINVNITVESYETIRDIAIAKGARNSPFYDWVRILVKEYKKSLEEIKEKQEFLELALRDKEELKNQMKRMREVQF